MPLIAPVLDDRRFEDIFNELRARIPVYNASWTDHHDSDPGITLLQLFAYLGEGLAFRLNQVPEATLLAFLQLLDIPLRPAQPARALLRFDLKRAPGAQFYAGDQVLAGKLAYTLDEDLTVWPLDCLAVSRQAELTPQQAADPARLAAYVAALDSEVGRVLQARIDAVQLEGSGVGAGSGGAGSGGAIAAVPVVPYSVVTLASDGSSSPLDPAAAVDPHLWLAVLAGEGLLVQDLSDPVQGLRPAAGRALGLSLGVRPATTWPGLDEVDACGDVPGAALQWQASIVKADGSLGWIALRSSGDSTAAFVREGVVRLELPTDLRMLGVPAAPAGLEGTGDSPPELDDAYAPRLWFWLRVWRGDGTRLPAMQAVLLNAVMAEQTAAAGPELLGSGSGQPGQVWALSQRPVAPGHAVRVQVEEDGVWRDWQPQPNLDASGPGDAHFVVDAEAGSLRFGARAPQLGQRIRVLGYRSGGGAAGNVPARAINKRGAMPDRPVPPELVRGSSASGLTLFNPFPATGGADAESLDAALARVPAELRHNHRAVTQDDFASLALQTPAAELGRAECLPRFHAPSRTRKPGCVSVVIWPARDPQHPLAPQPDAALLERVCRWLDRWRLVTTELYVCPPSYRRIAVALAVEVAPGFGLDGVRDFVDAALRQYLAPLPPLGPTGQGWPLGRRVMARELEGVVMQVEGVAWVEALRLDVATPVAATATISATDSATDSATTPATQSWAATPLLTLADWEVPELAAVTVVDAQTPLPAPGAGVVPPPSRPAVPVPVIKREC